MKKAFTLVELIVVITILSILSTVWFVAYTDYLLWTRDSSRIHQITSIHNAYNLYSTRSKVPVGKNNVVVNFGTANAGHQWDIDQSVLDTIKYSDWWRDPKTKDFFSYFISSDKKSIQVLWFLEENQELSYLWWADQSFASSYEELFPYVHGANLGILLEEVSQVPMHRWESLTGKALDIQTSTWSYVWYVSNTHKISGSWDELIAIVPYTSCKTLKDLNPTYQSGIYTINPSGQKIIQVYCDMELDGWGWTLVARAHENALPWRFGWMIEYGNIENDEDKYSLWEASKYLNFSEIMLARYDTGKNIEYAQAIAVDSSYIKNPSNYDSYSFSLGCREIYPTWTWASTCDQEDAWEIYNHRVWWYIDYRSDESETGHRDEWYFMRYYQTPTIGTLYGWSEIRVLMGLHPSPDRWFREETNIPSPSVFNDTTKWMILVR